jgi:hypothetical protein
MATTNRPRQVGQTSWTFPHFGLAWTDSPTPACASAWARHVLKSADAMHPLQSFFQPVVYLACGTAFAAACSGAIEPQPTRSTTSVADDSGAPGSEPAQGASTAPSPTGGAGAPNGGGGSSSPGAPGSGPASGSAPAGSSTPVPSNCNFAVPNVCEVCSDGETVCAHYAIRNGQCVTEICPPTAPPSGTSGGSCAQGMACTPGSGCGGGSSGGCSTSCSCDFTGHFQCTTGCSGSPGPGPSPCAQGASCQPNSGCGTAVPSGSNQCSTSCNCDPTGHYQCSEYCPDASAASGCTQGAPCPPGGNSVCGGGAIGGCSFSCSCDGTGHLQCTNSCPADASIATDASDG